MFLGLCTAAAVLIADQVSKYYILNAVLEDSFIIGGAVGNLIDRIRLGAVFDFLDFHIGEAHWPAFNVSDSFICIGAIIIIIHSLFNKDKSAI